MTLPTNLWADITLLGAPLEQEAALFVYVLGDLLILPQFPPSDSNLYLFTIYKIAKNSCCPKDEPFLFSDI